LEIDGAPVGRRLGQYSFKKSVENPDYQLNPDGSCMMVVFTDAPLDARNLERLAKRAMMGLAKTGGIASNGSGDYVIAVSVAPENLIDESTDKYYPTLLHNDAMSPLFEATIEATAEALWNSLFMATDMTGRDGLTIEALPIQSVLEILKK
jgi:D-aminopeptidase